MVEAPLGLAAFNVRRFGPGKVAEPAVLAALVRIVRRWDMILIQVESYTIPTTSQSVHCSPHLVFPEISNEL